MFFIEAQPASQQVEGQEAGFKINIEGLECVYQYYGDEECYKSIVVLQEVIEDEVKGDDEYKVLQVPEVDQGRMNQVIEQVGEGDGPDIGIPVRRVKDRFVTFLHQVEKEEEGKCPGEVGDDEAMPSGDHFLFKAEFFPGPEKEQIPREQGQTG